MDSTTLPDSYDIIIIGGAVIGSSVAFWLSRDPDFQGKILVIERDPTYAHASTALSAASIRLQFSNPINVEISKFGVEFIRGFGEKFAPLIGPCDLGFRENGYLFLAKSDRQCRILRENHDMQRGQGVKTCLLQPDKLKSLFPFLNVNDIKLASLGQKDEGWFDNMGLLNSFKSLAKLSNVNYLHGDVKAIERTGNSVISVSLANGRRISAGAVVNAAGPRARAVAAMAGIDLPVEPRKRTTFVFQSASGAPPAGTPLIVDHTGLYIRPEGDFWMGATQPRYDPEVDFDDFEPRFQEFDDVIWPQLANRAQIFEAIKLRRMWAGHYAYNTLDQNAIVGRHPDISNLYFANGFSGHGLQQAPAIGRGVAELILHDHFQTLDLTDLGFARILSGQPFRERAIV